MKRRHDHSQRLVPPIKNQSKPVRQRSVSFRVIVTVLIGAGVILGLWLNIFILFSQTKEVPSEHGQLPANPHREIRSEKNDSEFPLRSYDDWKLLTLRLAALPAREAIATLERHDPFGTRRFETSLLEAESRLQRILEFDEVKAIFPCPEGRITLPDQRDPLKAEAFRRGDPGTFLFFQHLRKAGGTNFCSLAETNLPKASRPSYYCMPDWEWSSHHGAGFLHHWNNANITSRMTQSGHRIAGNEWDTFDVQHHFDLPAVFCTSFRRPLDRALSQFRFECIEDRGCKTKNVTNWWARRTDLINVYTTTFSDPETVGLKRIYETAQHAAKRQAIMEVALDTVAKFHLVLVMEWLGYAAPLVKGTLGFDDVSALTKRVRPHIGQFQRHDGQEVNKLGAAGIAKASWVAKDYLDPNQYQIMTEHLAMDEILTDAARRMFLERLVCQDV